MYDDAFARKYNGNQQQIKRAIDKILVTANSYYKLKSLTTKIELDTTNLPYYKLSGTYTATGNNLDRLRPIIQSFSRDADSYSILSYENNQGGTTGIAWGGTTCVSTQYKGYKTNINEHFRDDMNTAATLVHEIGHNLGMKHDFGTEADGYTDTRQERFTRSGEKCTKIEGFMDYYGKTTKWSACSVQDFTDYYNSVRTWCLPEFSGGSNPAPVTTRRPTTTTRRTTRRPPSNCRDRATNCRELAQYCQFLPSLQTYWCKRTCGTC